MKFRAPGPMTTVPPPLDRRAIVDAVGPAGLDPDVLAHPARGPQDDGEVVQLPDPEHRRAAPLLGVDQQGLVEGDVRGDGRAGSRRGNGGRGQGIGFRASP